MSALHALSPISIPELQAKLLSWQQTHGRHDLPWQQHPTPYQVLVSEIMLQQTQVTTVIPYFNQWMTRFPTLEALAASSEDDVMRHWQGLGYYSRARNLKKAALYIIEEHQGIFPRALSELLKIPGVGRYTAGAIAAFAFNQYGPIVDGNVKRFFARLFAIDGIPNTSGFDKQIWQLAHDYTPEESTGHNSCFAQGLLDMGATICTPKKPKCTQCIFQTNCLGLAQQRVEQLPTPKPKKIQPIKQGHFLWLIQDDQLLLEKRPDNGIWGGLWCLPELAQLNLTTQTMQGEFKHTFTHYKLEANVWAVDARVADQAPQYNPNQRFISAQQLDAIGLPTPIKKFIAKHFPKRKPA